MSSKPANLIDIFHPKVLEEENGVTRRIFRRRKRNLWSPWKC